MKKNIILLFVVLLFGSVCVSMEYFGASIPLSGETAVDAKWQPEILSVVYSRAARATDNCNKILFKDTKFLSHKGAVVRNSDGEVISGVWQEEWIVNACGQEVSIPVKLDQRQFGTSFKKSNLLRYDIGKGKIID